MADSTYDHGSKIYRKQGATELVIASTGQITLENGSEFEIESGGVIDVESGGEINIDSGGTLDLNSGAGFYAVDTTFTADKLKNFFISEQTHSCVLASATVLSASQIDSTNGMAGYGYIAFSEPTGLSLASITLPDSPDSGMMLYLNGKGLVGDANVSVCISGASLINACGTSLSGVNISAMGYCRFICIAAGQWAITDGDITEIPG